MILSRSIRDIPYRGDRSLPAHAPELVWILHALIAITPPVFSPFLIMSEVGSNSAVFYTSTKYATFDEGLLLSLGALTHNWLPLSNVDDRSYSVLQPMASNEDGAKKIRMVRWIVARKFRPLAMSVTWRRNFIVFCHLLSRGIYLLYVLVAGIWSVE